MTFGDIEIKTAADWVAVDELFKAELQSINAEINDLVIRQTQATTETEINKIKDEIAQLQSIRANIVKNYSEYQEKRRTKLQ